MDAMIKEVLQQFFPGQEIVSAGPHGSGHINHTYAVETAEGGKYVLQKINTDIFRDVEGLMENVVNVTDYLRRQIAGEEPTRSSSGNGIGLKNVQDRIQMAYGPEYGLRVESQPGGGTAVTVTFPFHEAMEGSP